MYRNTREMKKAEGFELLTQKQRKKFYELVYEINEELRDRDERGRTIFERKYTKMSVRQDRRAEREKNFDDDVEVEITLESGETRNFQSSILF